MALVAYGNSDSSDYEDEVEEDAPVVLLNIKTESKHGTHFHTHIINTCDLYIYTYLFFHIVSIILV